MANPSEEFLMAGETARRLGVSTQTVMDFVRRGDLPAAGHTTAGYNLFREADVMALVKKRNANPPRRGPKQKKGSGKTTQ